MAGQRSPGPPAGRLLASPRTDTYTAVNTPRVRCEDVTFVCSRPQNVIKMIHFSFESRITPYFYSQRLILLSDRTKHLVFPNRNKKDYKYNIT